jgi:hypothetical protein
MELDIRKSLNEAYATIDSVLSQKEADIECLSRGIISSKDAHEALKNSLLLSYHIVEFRSTLSSELSRLSTIEMSSINEQSKALVKKQLQAIQSRYNRLSDLREDLELVQKLSYSNRIHI